MNSTAKLSFCGLLIGLATSACDGLVVARQASADTILVQQMGFHPTGQYLLGFAPGAVVSVDTSAGVVTLICKAADNIGGKITADESPYPNTALLGEETIATNMRQAFDGLKTKLLARADFSSVVSLAFFLSNAKTHSLADGIIRNAALTNRNSDCLEGLKRAEATKNSDGTIPTLSIVDTVLIGDGTYGVVFQDHTEIAIQNNILDIVTNEFGAKYDKMTGKIVSGQEVRWGVHTIAF